MRIGDVQGTLLWLVIALVIPPSAGARLDGRLNPARPRHVLEWRWGGEPAPHRSSTAREFASGLFARDEKWGWKEWTIIGGSVAAVAAIAVIATRGGSGSGGSGGGGGGGY